MKKSIIKGRIAKYFKDNHIICRLLDDDGNPTKSTSADIYYLATEIPGVTGGCIETTLFFEDDYIYTKSYYGRALVTDSNKDMVVRAACICNWMNNYLRWDCNSLYTHRYVFDGFDIFNDCNIKYDIFEHYPQESYDHILNFTVQQLADVGKEVADYVAGNMDFDEATSRLSNKLIKKVHNDEKT